jgi:hypothetical protein
MRRNLRPVLIAVAVIVLISVLAVISLTARSDPAAVAASSPGTTDADGLDQATRDSLAAEIARPNPTSAPTTTIDQEALAAYLQAVQEHEAWVFVDQWYQAEQARIAEEQRLAEERRRAATAITTRPPAHTPAATGGGSGCVIPAYICQRESGMSYTALNASSGAGGMYQLMPSTANAVARRIGRYDLVGVPPHLMAPADQDLLAATLWDGGRGCQHWLACG